MSRSLKLGFVGDTSLTGIFWKKVNSKQEIFCNEIKTILQDNDYNVCNFEGPATNLKNILRTDVTVISPPESVSYLAQNKFNIFNLANNHVFDCDEAGFLETKQLIDENNIHCFGAGQNITEAMCPLYIEKNNIKIALIGCAHKEGLIASASSSGIFYMGNDNIERFYDYLLEIKKSVDWLIINYHGGEEYTLVPSPYKRKLLHKLAEFADIVIAHHSHTVQCIEKINDKIIFFSLGNFIFDIPCHKAWKETQSGVLVNITFDKITYNYEIINTHIDTVNGVISKLNKPIETIYIDNRLYVKMWHKEAAKVFFSGTPLSANKNMVSTKSTNYTNVRNNKYIYLLKKVFSIRSYSKVIKMLRHENCRCILLGALMHKINSFFSKIKA